MLFSLSVQFFLCNLICFAILKCLVKLGCESVKCKEEMTVYFMYCNIVLTVEIFDVLGSIIYIRFFKALLLAKLRQTSVYLFIFKGIFILL